MGQPGADRGYRGAFLIRFVREMEPSSWSPRMRLESEAYQESMAACDKDKPALAAQLMALRAGGTETPVKPKNLAAALDEARAPAEGGAEKAWAPPGLDVFEAQEPGAGVEWPQ